jgi:3-deoxy-D-manno-octulosonate 8-phosphate phosphatase (KDO 8-P phosphatase)
LNLKKIQAVVFDFDGVFTNNRVIVREDGNESVICNRSDGLGIERLRKLNIPMVIISTEQNPVVSMRAKKLKLPEKHGVKNKKIELEKFASSVNVKLKNIVFIGNDINDLECMNSVGFPIAVADAFEEIKEVSIYTLTRNGGDGAVREFCDLIYQSYKNGE